MITKHACRIRVTSVPSLGKVAKAPEAHATKAFDHPSSGGDNPA